jgi:transposase InsO family protein
LRHLRVSSQSRPAAAERSAAHHATQALRPQLKELEQVVPYEMKNFHTDNGGEFLNWALYRHLTGRPAKLPWTRSRAYRKNDNAHCEQKNWTHVRQLFGHERFGHPELVALMNELYAKEWSQFTNHFKPTFKLLKREKQAGRTKRIYEQRPQTPYERLLESPDISEAIKVKLREQHTGLDPYELKKSIEAKLRKFFIALANLDRESTKT